MAQSASRRIGIFGGTFDPIHVGHLAVGSAAAHGAGLDEVLFVVAHRPWQKVGSRSIAPSAVRLEMVRAATESNDRFVASSIEIDRGGSSYTIDTVEQLRDEHPDATFVLVIGSDVVGDLDTWHRHDELRDMVEVAVIDRPGDVGAVAPPGWRVTLIDAPLIDLSSTMLRERMAANQPVDYLVPSTALAIWRHHQEHAEA